MTGAAEAVNVNTDTSAGAGGEGGEPIVKGGAEALTFDELDSVMSNPGTTTKKKNDADKKVKKEKPADEDSEGAGDDPKSGAKEKKKEPAKGDGEGDKEGDDSDGAAEGKSKDKKESDDKFKSKQKYKVDLGDGKTAEIPAGTKFKTKVGEVELQELLNDYNGKVHYGKKLNDLASRERQFETSVTEINEAIQTAYNMAVKDNNPKGMVTFISELIGADPGKVWTEMKQQIRKQMGVEETDDHKNEDMRDNLEIYQERDKRAATKQQKAKEAQAMQSRFDTVMKNTGMTDSQLVETYDTMVASGKYAKDSITPEMIGEYFGTNQATSIAEEAAQELGDLENPEKVVQLMREAKLKFPDFTKDDLVQVAKEALGLKSKAAKNLSQKVKKADPSTTAKRPTNPRQEPMSWDDLE